jgi:hypothetical protein
MSKITADAQPANPPIPETAWSPLRQPLFRALWLASVASNIGTWMQNVGAAWLMTSLAPSPTMVALVQAATTLPVFLIGLPAGAIADLLDRRRLLLATQGWMLVAATLLGVLTFFDATTPWLLLSLTFALGLGAAINAPAWQAIDVILRLDLIRLSLRELPFCTRELPFGLIQSRLKSSRIDLEEQLVLFYEGSILVRLAQQVPRDLGFNLRVDKPLKRADPVLPDRNILLLHLHHVDLRRSRLRRRRALAGMEKQWDYEQRYERSR